MRIIRERESPYGSYSSGVTLSFPKEVPCEEIFDFVTNFRNGPLVFSNHFYTIERVMVDGREPTDPDLLRKIGAPFTLEGRVRVEAGFLVRVAIEEPLTIDLTVSEYMPPTKVEVRSTGIFVKGREIGGLMQSAWTVFPRQTSTDATLWVGFDLGGPLSFFFPRQKEMRKELAFMGENIYQGFMTRRGSL